MNDLKHRITMPSFWVLALSILLPVVAGLLEVKYPDWAKLLNVVVASLAGLRQPIPGQAGAKVDGVRIRLCGLVAVVAYLIWVRRFEHSERDDAVQAERRRQALLAQGDREIDDLARAERERIRVEFDRRRADADKVREMNDALKRGRDRWPPKS